MGMKHIITAVGLVLISSAAHAASYNTSCGPQLDTSISQSAYGSDGPTFKIGIKWNITKNAHKSCKEHNKAATEEARANARKADSYAKQEEADLLQQRIRICNDFELTTAPQSIRDFCGDLLQ